MESDRFLRKQREGLRVIGESESEISLRLRRRQIRFELCLQSPPTFLKADDLTLCSKRDLAETRAIGINWSVIIPHGVVDGTIFDCRITRSRYVAFGKTLGHTPW